MILLWILHKDGSFREIDQVSGSLVKYLLSKRPRWFYFEKDGMVLSWNDLGWHGSMHVETSGPLPPVKWPSLYGSPEDDPAGMVLLRNDPTSMVLKRNDPASMVLLRNDPTSMVLLRNDPASMVLLRNDPARMVLLRNDPASMVLLWNDPASMVLLWNDLYRVDGSGSLVGWPRYKWLPGL
jgi:hypothetical protein